MEFKSKDRMKIVRTLEEQLNDTVNAMLLNNDLDVDERYVLRRIKKNLIAHLEIIDRVINKD